jgi:hypothetical protein
MKDKKKKTIMIIALISILICGCPGCFLVVGGIDSLSKAVGSINSFDDLLSDLGEGFAQGGWMLILGAVLVMVPFILAIIAVLIRSKIEKLEKLEPTGVSKDDPIPPAS